MRLLDRLERRFRRYAVPNLTVILIAGQVALYALGSPRPDLLERIAFIPARFLDGEIWRILTFVFDPPISNLFFAFFFWYLFYLMGTTLEHTWGTFRYNVFLLVGYVATVAAAFLMPQMPASVGFLQGSVFLAFAYLYPDFQLLLFFLLPVKVKWLALLQWIGYFLTIAFAPWIMKLMATAAVVNFFVFFGKDIALRVRSGKRRMESQASRIKARSTPRHRCAVCGITNLTHPDMDFRYCSECRRHALLLRRALEEPPAHPEIGFRNDITAMPDDVPNLTFSEGTLCSAG